MKTVHHVNSSAVARLEHEGDTCTVHYKSGGSYTFPADAATIEGISRADSVGKALHAHLTTKGIKPAKRENT